MNTLELINLGIGYGKKTLVSNANAKLCNNELVVILGKNGTGKSTLIKSILGLLPIINGKILLNNTNVAKLSNNQKARLFSVVFSRLENLPNIAVSKVLELGRTPYHGLYMKLSVQEKKLIDNIVHLIGLDKIMNTPCNQLSDGQLQKVMIAKALVQDTPFVLLDEPSSHLDIQNQLMLYELIAKLKHQTNKHFIISTHHADLALQVADQLWWLNNNKLCAGITEEIAFKQKIYDQFSNQHVSFDYGLGKFTIHKNTCEEIGFQSDDSALAYWAEHLIKRLGYKPTKTNNTKMVKVCNHAIEFKNQGESKTLQNIHQLYEVLCPEGAN